MLIHEFKGYGRLSCLLLVLNLGSATLDRLAAAESSGELLQKAAQAYRQGKQAQAFQWLDQAVKADPQSSEAYALRGSLYSDRGQSTNAIADFDQALKLDKSVAAIYQRRGVEHFKLGHIEKSIADFDQFLERVPAQEPYHWQRGISYYYAGQFKEGRRQFEIHQTVNRQDVENAVWHFLCVVRQAGLKEAQAKLIPISGDTRVPMKQVHQLFAGGATPEDVWKAAQAGDVSPEVRRRHEFYAHLYLGLYYEAIGEEPKAREHIFKAAALSEAQNYMGVVARVHADRLKK
jgi:lipoprotein NlpI